MAVDWREQLRQLPDAALIDVENYAAELDAIDAAIRKSVEAHGGKTSMSPFGWGDPVHEDSGVTRVIRRPVAPIVASDPARIAVALLQRLHFSRCSFFSEVASDEKGSFHVLLAMADRLMKRKLMLSPEAGRDLARVLNAPPPGKWPVQLFEYLPQGLKQLKQSFSPPVPGILGAALKELHASLSRPIPKQSWERRKKSSVPKRHQNACERIERLLGG